MQWKLPRAVSTRLEYLVLSSCKTFPSNITPHVGFSYQETHYLAQILLIIARHCHKINLSHRTSLILFLLSIF